ncbi:hypothetical protein QZJ86_10375 [Methylomonas montana]|uniref:hypothetical protein n=1 Tax=Methylomonas montana TaxID=3058963 RepID=UPI002659C1D7|nr:hypothetical protein [Methylomonas montana]WKJ92525.1 hypothetical protein QZJ86_10375 [Methylomonas montana]
MKITDFWFLNVLKILLAATGVLIFCATNVLAGSTEPYSQQSTAELILTLSDQWQASDANDSMRSNAGSLFDARSGAKLKAKPVDLGCGVDVNHFPSEDNSLRSRFVGECNLNYRY